MRKFTGRIISLKMATPPHDERIDGAGTCGRSLREEPTAALRGIRPSFAAIFIL